MQITNTNINSKNEVNFKNKIQQHDELKTEQTKESSSSELPSVYNAGQSLINKDNPISYTKLGEITIPGLKDKASIFKLANGQRVIIAPKKGPTMVKTTYNVGSLNETEDIRGISHFIEHNLFNGSKDLAPDEYDKKIAELGANTNASTNFSVTDYYLSLQLLNDNSLEKAIKLNSQLSQFPSFPVEQLEKEKEPVKSEIDMYKDMPSDVSGCIALKNLFNINTQSDNFILGTKDNINSFTREKVLDYFNTWYTPDNAVTVITGDVNTDETIKLVSKYYNKQNDYSKINKRHYEPINYTDKPVREDIIKPNANNADIVMCFAIPEGTSSSDNKKIDILLKLLMSSSSDFAKSLDKDGLYMNFYKEKIQNKPDGAQAIIGNISCNENDVEKVVKTLYEQLLNIAYNPPSQTLLDNIKKHFINSMYAETDESVNLNNILTNLALQNDLNYYDNIYNFINSLTPQDISQTAKKFLDLNKVSMCVSHEKNATPQSINNNYQMAYQNQIQNGISFKGAAKPKQNILDIENNISQYTLPNNIETMTINGNPIVSSEFNLKYTTDKLDKIPEPALNILSTILNHGNLLNNNDSLNELKDSLDLNFNFEVNNNGININSYFYKENTSQALSLIFETLNNPNFTEAEFQRAKDIERDNINSENISAYNKLGKNLYPDLKKFDSKEEKLEQLESLTLQDIRNLYSLILSSSKATSSFTSSFEENPELKNIYNNMLSSLNPVKPFTLEKSPNYYIYKPINQSKILVTEDERAQAEIVQNYTYKNSENIDDIAKIKILNIILGSGMSSRLFSDLREDKKLAYTVTSDYFAVKDTGNFSLYIETTTDSPDPKEGSPENINKALDGFNRNIELLKTQNVTDKELENAKTILKTNILNRLETNLDKNELMSETKNSPYGTRYLSSLYDAIDKITPDDIRNTAEYVFANQPVTSIVASKKTLDTLNLK